MTDPKSKAQTDKDVDDQLKDTFPASDPPAATQPGSGVTGAEPAPERGERKDRKAPVSPS